MGHDVWKRPWSRLLKGKAIEVALPMETPELYLDLTTRCMEQVNRLCLERGSPLPKFNQEQCKHLAIKLQLAIHSANSIIADVNKEFLSLAHPEKVEHSLEIFKLLSATGVEVEGFIQNCCREAWIQSAVMLLDTLETVTTIGLNLEFCTKIFFAKQSQKRITLIPFDATRIREVEFQIVKEKVDLDAMKLNMDLRNVIQSNASNQVEWKLATFLLERSESTMLPTNMNMMRSHERVLPLTITSLQQLPDCLGKGAFAIVHKATWFGVEVAKKTFYGPTSADFFREVSILKGLNHPNIVSLLWSMSDGKRCHLVMEMMDGDLFSLMHQRMEGNKNQGFPFNIQEAMDLILQIGEGMLYLHEKRVVHRDLKSHNILIRYGKVAKENVKYLQVKVSDFGLSRTKERSATYSDMSLNVGTTRWMAPEVMRVGSVQSDGVGEQKEAALHYPFKTDIYSFAMVCYEILTGELPFSGLNHSEVKEAVLNGDRPPLPRECPNKLRRLIEACWSGDASMRPSFGNICKELRHLKYANLQMKWKATIYGCPLEDIVTIDEHVAKLSNPILNVQQSAIKGLSFLAKKSFDHRIYIKEQEAMPLLVLLYYSREYLMSDKHITIALQVLSIDDEEFDQDRHPQKHSLKELSSLQISDFVSSFSRETFLSCAVGPIIEVLKFGHMKARENATKALVEISSDLGSKVKEKIRNPRVVLALVTLLEAECMERKEYAAILLFRASRSFQEVPSAIQAMIVPPLMNLIAHYSDGIMLDDAFKILVTLTEVQEGLIAIAAIRPTPTLVKFITPKSCRNMDRAILILLRLCLHDLRFMNEVRESNVIEPLIHSTQYNLISSSKQLAKGLLHLLQKEEEEEGEDLPL